MVDHETLVRIKVLTPVHGHAYTCTCYPDRSLVVLQCNTVSHEGWFTVLCCVKGDTVSLTSR